MFKLNFNRFKSIIKKEIIQIKRDPISLRIPFAMPIVMMFLFGYAVNKDVDNINLSVFDQSMTQESREFIDAFEVSGYFTIGEYTRNREQIAEMLDSGKTSAVLIIPSDFAADIKTGVNPEPLLIIDGTDPTIARTALTNGILISSNFTSGLQGRLLSGTITLNTNVWNNPNMESNLFTIPGLVGLIVQNVTIMLTAFALVREKERGTIEQLIITPVRPVELILGKLIPYIVIGFIGFLFALTLCILWFQVEVAGSIIFLCLMGFLFVLCSLSIGMLISTFASNQLQAMMVIMVVILPTVLLSGFVFPRESMPVFINFIGYLLPLTYFLTILRGVVLKGTGMNYLWPEFAVLCVFTIIIILIAVKRFRKSLD
jgi:ABC-2 type transport system permease protein